MLDPKIMRDEPKLVKEGLKKRGLDVSIVDEWQRLDKLLKELRHKNDELRHKRNIISQKINEYKKLKDEKSARDAINEAKSIPEKIKNTDEEIRKVEDQIKVIIETIPNLPDSKVPVGKSAEDNKVVRKWGKIKEINHAKSHVEILENLGLLDMKTSAKIAGEGFYILKGQLAVLERALINFFLDYHNKKGRIEISPPIMANSKSAFGTAHLPKFDNDMYKTREDLYLVPTAELPLTNLHQDSVIKEDDLPLRYCAYTPCFRTEAGKHGTETRGLFRLHQFDKVEMMTFAKPEDSARELDSMVYDAEKILQMLNIPYRILLLCSGDMGFASSITYDIETYSPFLKKYLETSSCSNCKDFQSRRMNTKFWRNKTGEREFVHTLNGSGLALPRLMIALIENNQNEDGSVNIPSVLWKYTGFRIMGKKEEKKARVKSGKKISKKKQI